MNDISIICIKKLYGYKMCYKMFTVMITQTHTKKEIYVFPIL